MKKAKQARRWIALLLAVVLALPLIGPAQASADSSGGETGAASGYFEARYPTLAGQEHVFETVTYYELDYLLRNAGTLAADNHIILFGGSWQPETQQAIGYINEVAKEYGITSIKNFDTRIATPDVTLDITQDEGVYGDFSRRYVDLGFRYLTNLNDHTDASRGVRSFNYTVDGETVTANVNVVDAPFLFIYNKGRVDSEGNPAPIVASLEGIAALDGGGGAQAYKAQLEQLFDTISNPGTKVADFKVLSNEEYIIGSYNEFKGSSEPNIFEAGDNIVIDSVTLDELQYALSTEGTHAVLIGCAWCTNTRAVVKYVNEIALEYGIDKVYNWDTKLDGGVAALSSASRPTWGETSGGNYLQTRNNNQIYTHVYTDWINEYLPNLISQNSQAANPTRISGVNPNNGEAVVSERLQAPYVFVYNKENYNVIGEGAEVQQVWNPILGHVELMLSWTQSGSNAWRGTSNPEGPTAQLYKQYLNILFSRLEWKPEGLTAVGTSAAGAANGAIEGIARKSLEYRLKGASQYIPVPDSGNTISDLSPGVYEVRYASKSGIDSAVFPSGTQTVTGTQRPYQPGPAVDIAVPEYQAPPVGLVGVAPTEAEGNGQIVFVDVSGEQQPLPSGLQYKLQSAPESAYADVASDFISVEPSQYYDVRFAAKTVNNVGSSPLARIRV